MEGARWAWSVPDYCGVDLTDRVGSVETLDAALAGRSDSYQKLAADSTDGIVLQPLTDLDRLPTKNVGAFARAVNEGANIDLPAGALMVESIDDLFRQQPISPTARAAVWRLLASLPGATYRDELTDRVGRRGEAITIDDNAHGLPTRYQLIIDPTNGELLEYDEILTTDAGKLNVRIAAVISLTVFLDAGRTSTLTDRPLH